MGSDSDLPTMQEASKILKQFEIPYEIGVYSAHRSPHRTAEYVRSARDRGLKVDYRRCRQLCTSGGGDGRRDDAAGHWCADRQFAAIGFRRLAGDGANASGSACCDNGRRQIRRNQRRDLCSADPCRSAINVSPRSWQNTKSASKKPWPKKVRKSRNRHE